MFLLSGRVFHDRPKKCLGGGSLNLYAEHQHLRMTFSEAETLFHEFGHGLQHMLTHVEDLGCLGADGSFQPSK